MTRGRPGLALPRRAPRHGRGRFLRYDLCVRQGDGTWPSLVKALVWGTREPGFKSRRPDSVFGQHCAACPAAGIWHDQDPWFVARAVSTSDLYRPGGGRYPGEPEAAGGPIPRAARGRRWLRRVALLAAAAVMVLVVGFA